MQQESVQGVGVPDMGNMPVGGVLGMNVMGQQLGYDDKKGPSGGVQAEGPAKRRRVWTEAERNQHKQACQGKQKLTYGQKMEIIRRHESSDSEEHRTQAQLAEMFNKSRSAISKILRPEAMDRIKATAAAGIDQAVKRYFPPEHPELERRLYQRIEATFRKQPQDGSNKSNFAVGSQTLCSNAEQIAKEMGIENFKPTAGWYSRFVKRYGLAKPAGEETVGLPDSSPIGSGSSLMNIASSIAAGVGQSDHAVAAVRPMDSGVSIPVRSTRQVNFKATWQGQAGITVSNTRRLEVQIDLDDNNNMVGGFEATMNLLRQTFQQELMQSQARVSYKEFTGEDVVISSDIELSLAISHYKGFQGGAVKLTLSPISL